MKLGFPKVAVKLSGLYGQSTYDYTMLGGYVIINDPDTVKGFETYENITILSAWAEVMTTGKKIQGGLFLGYSKNLGTQDPFLSAPVYARGSDKGAGIDYLYRIAPRFIYNIGKFRLAPEIEYTVAGYGTTSDTDGKVSDAEPVGNFRFLLGVYYFF